MAALDHEEVITDELTVTDALSIITMDETVDDTLPFSSSYVKGDLLERILYIYAHDHESIVFDKPIVFHTKTGGDPIVFYTETGDLPVVFYSTARKSLSSSDKTIGVTHAHTEVLS